MAYALHRGVAMPPASALFSTVALAALVATSACSRKAPPREGVRIAAKVAPAASAAPAAPVAADAHGSRKKKGLDVPVFVDGKQVGVLRHGELPATLGAHASADRARGDARYYRLGEYLAAVGVAAERVRAVHLRGNAERIASVEGDELRKEPSRFVFDFMEKDTGIGRLRWDTTGLRNTFRIEEIRALFVYVDRDAPALAQPRSCYLEGNVCSDKVPYAEGEIAKGTRVYVDGKLAFQVKRRALKDELVVGRDDDGLHRFDLAKLLAANGIDMTGAKSVELMAGDDVIGRAPAAALAKAPATFVIPPHAHGRVRVTVPQTWAAVDSEKVDRADVSAVLIYRTQTPKKRELTPLSEAVTASEGEGPVDG